MEVSMRSGFILCIHPCRLGILQACFDELIYLDLFIYVFMQHALDDVLKLGLVFNY